MILAKKKILFVSSRMNVGGVEKALLGLLSTIDFSRSDVTLGLIYKDGGLLEYVPEQVRIVEIDSYRKYWRWLNDTPYQIIVRYLKRFNITGLAKYIHAYWLSKRQGNQVPLFKAILKHQKKDETVYDVAISYSGPFHALDYYIINHVKAKKKVGWIHFDVSKFGINDTFVRTMYPKFDEINLVSQQGKDVFDKRFPELADKTKVVYNIIDKNLILKQSEEPIDDMPTDKCDHIRIVTVGRVSEEKGQYDVLPYFKEAIDNGLNAVWYFVGGGKDLERCRKKAEELGIADNVRFLGVKTNPYPYMRHCDVYVQSSRHEGYCITLAEAKLFGHPIITTPFTGAKEQLKNYEYSSSIIPLGLLPDKLIEYANDIGDNSDI